MDFGTVFGLIALVALVFTGIATNQITSSLINFHGIFVVFGGVFVAMLVSTPLNYLVKAVTELRSLMFEDETGHLKRTLPVLVTVAEQCRMKGISALKDVDRKLANGFLGRVADAALDSNDYKFVKTVIEQEINEAADEMNEIVNVYTVMGLLAPMFGLLGTLIGIIGVLKQLSDPESVGPAMGVAITSAFYGILFANMVCVPISCKIRARIWLRVKLKSMILEGVLEIMKGSMPLAVERRLQAFLIYK